MFAYVDRAFNAMNGMESYVAAHFLMALGAVKSDTYRVPLTEEPKTIPLMGPEGRIVLLNTSVEKGIKFHLHTENTPPLSTETASTRSSRSRGRA